MPDKFKFVPGDRVIPNFSGVKYPAGVVITTIRQSEGENQHHVVVKHEVSIFDQQIPGGVVHAVWGEDYCQKA